MKNILFSIFFISTLCSQTIIRVPKDYDKIQTALDSSNSHDTILVSQGIYHENLSITKPITMIGDTNGTTMITTDSLYLAAIYINTSNVLLRNFHIVKEPANEGIMIVNSDSCTIDKCVIDTNLHILSFTDKNYFYGIYVLSSKNILVTNSIIKDNKGGASFWGTSVEGGDAIGIRIEWSSDIEVKNCQLYNNKRGESSEGTYGNGTGINVINSTHNIYIRNCSIYKNNIGIMFYYFNSLATVGGSPLFANDIYGNSDYNIRNNSDTTINATYNYWGTSDRDSIEATLWGNVDIENYITSIQPLIIENPGTFILYQNYPNPFNPVTHIKYILPSAGEVQIKIYDSIGRLVKELYDGYQYAGSYEVLFNDNNLSSGVYYYLIEYNGRKKIKKMVILK
jgi:hypothetical protein